jgi:hypothetical protein
LAKHLILAIALTFALPAVAKQSGHHNASVSKTTGPAATRQGGTVHGGSSHARELRRAPDLDPARKVNVQDCTKPLDLEAGNVKCK